MKSQLLIGAASSGSGKTTFTLGLLRALRNRGLAVQPFKCGPDYIDTQYHTMAAGNESVNLDSYLSSAGHIRELYARYGAGARVCVTEGVMGLLDGYDGPQGSSAEIAGLLDLPVVLLVNAKSTAYSVAPVIYGFRHFCSGLRIAGVVFNKVASPAHYASLLRACRDAGVESLGYLPFRKDMEIPSRHLGLTLEEGFRFDAFTARIAELVETHVDIDRLLEVTASPFPVTPPVSGKAGGCSGRVPDLKIAVACDEAFNFVYRENIVRLQQAGDVAFFSPLTDSVLPQADFVYFPGGYPEFFLPRLSSNTSMLASVKRYAEAGGKIWAECGGLMYLCRSVTGMDGENYPMAGVFPLGATMEQMKLKLGYRQFRYRERTWRGHEFHYSRIVGSYPSVAALSNARNEPVDTPLYRYKNVLAGYTHVYWGENNVFDLF
ncbi:MAG: cobyrinate a,c-diamide synthase [Parabacteroides sp.]|nr:cobyrinate a,c-diamide synthase [Parabacteroides sp.]